MERQKTKLGARILSKEELNAILPNAESIYEQIEVFRESIPDESNGQGHKQYETEQKTNNIGIMGRRGAGKTSILKTFYHILESEDAKDKEKAGDIILPIIIPENMSSGTTLMDAILGRLKSIVDEKMEEEKEKKYLGDCIYSGKRTLEGLYNELVKQYCYIKKDYRDILIQQFTTEQNYVDKTKKVFSSDSEFITMFNRFVTKLLQKEGKQEKKNSMMFLFIDDVDLSTNRCMDIVRTLLVYLSNPRIVTFISGDIETFEEELTLEFLRQEEALREDVFRETFYSVNNISGSSLLERKKTLAYEYLKKIIPPAYRRTIRYWDLEERGNYKIIGNEGGKEKSLPDERKSLVELLVEVTKEKKKLGEMYFVYKEDDKKKNMKLAFHMFDDTSRGLNNVYNVLQEIYDRQKNEKDIADEEKALLLWRLIEAMVDSKPLYAKHKTELLKYVIVLGQGRIKVDFGNAYQLLYGEEKIEKDNKESGNRKTIFSPTDRFALYFLIDFAWRLFSKENSDNEDNSKYSDLKNWIIQEYLCSEEIDDKIPVEWELLECLVEAREDKKKNTINSILLSFLRECDFIFTLHLIRYLGRENIYSILKDEKRFDDKEKAYKIAYALSRAVQTVNQSEDNIKEYLADLYIQMQNVMLDLLSRLSLDKWIIYGRQIVDKPYIKDGMRYMACKPNMAESSFMNIENYLGEGSTIEAEWRNLLWAEYENKNTRYWIYYERELKEKQERNITFSMNHEETVFAGLIKAIMIRMQKFNVMDSFEVKSLKSVDYNGILTEEGKKIEKIVPVLEQIDERQLWNRTYSKERIKPYIERKKIDIIHKLCCGRVIFDATELVKKGAYFALKGCNKGSSGAARIYHVESKVRRVMALSVKDDKSEPRPFSDGRIYLRFEQVFIIVCLLDEFLLFHSRVVYGKKEARQLLMEVKELPLVLHTSEWNKIDEELTEREEKFFGANPDFLRDENEKMYEIENILKDKGISKKPYIDDIRVAYYETGGKKVKMQKLIKAILDKNGEDNVMYFSYLVQNRQIQKRKKELRDKLEETQKEVKDWESFEPEIPEKESIFFFHSYLRYQQANNSEAKKAGARAEDIVKLAHYMLDSEIKADTKVQNEIYQIISQEIDITEEEFETLF